MLRAVSIDQSAGLLVFILTSLCFHKALNITIAAGVSIRKLYLTGLTKKGHYQISSRKKL